MSNEEIDLRRLELVATMASRIYVVMLGAIAGPLPEGVTDEVKITTAIGTAAKIVAKIEGAIQ